MEGKIKTLQEVLGRTNYLLFFDMTRTTQKTMCPTIFVLLHVFTAMGISLPRRYLAMAEGIHIERHKTEKKDLRSMH
jgi:hypothetical protein